MDSGNGVDTTVEDHPHICQKCSEVWLCDDETCENDGVSKYWWSELDDPICMGDDFSGILCRHL